MNPKKLTPHPLLSALPRIPEELPATQAFLDDIRAHGIRQALLVDSENRILDGVRRWEAARQLGIDVEVQVVAAGGEIAAILGSLTQRRHLTKGQLAYTVFPLLKPALEEAKQRRLQNLREGKSPKTDSIGFRDFSSGTVEDLCRSLGFSKDTFDQARQLHEMAESDEELRFFIEKSIFEDGSGLGGVLGGIAGRNKTKGQSRLPSVPIRFVQRAYSACETFANRWSRPELYDENSLTLTRQKLQTTFGKLPDEAIDEMEGAIRQVRRERKGAA